MDYWNTGVFGITPSLHYSNSVLSLIDHRPQPRYPLLVGDADYAHRFKLKRAAQPLDHFRVRRYPSFEPRHLPRRAVAADADDGVDLGEIEQQRRLQPSVSGEVSPLDSGLDVHILR